LKQRPPTRPQRIDSSKPKIIPRCSAFTYAINSHDIIEFDYFTGMERACADYPTPAALWERYRAGSTFGATKVAEQLLIPFNHTAYKQIARLRPS
jgi:hypothetical protein